MVELFANSGDPDQTPHSAASDLGLHCLPEGYLVSNGLNEHMLQSVEVFDKTHGNVTNSVNPDLHSVASDQGQHYLHRSVCPNS